MRGQNTEAVPGLSAPCQVSVPSNICPLSFSFFHFMTTVGVEEAPLASTIGEKFDRHVLGSERAEIDQRLLSRIADLDGPGASNRCDVRTLFRLSLIFFFQSRGACPRGLVRHELGERSILGSTGGSILCTMRWYCARG